LTHRQNVIQIKAYVEKRHQRMRTLINAYPTLTSFPVLLTLPELEALWECAGTGKLLRTMSRAYPEEFFYERFETGRGSKPAVYALGIQPSLIDKLLTEDERGENPAEDILTFAA